MPPSTCTCIFRSSLLALAVAAVAGSVRASNDRRETAAFLPSEAESSSSSSSSPPPRAAVPRRDAALLSTALLRRTIFRRTLFRRKLSDTDVINFFDDGWGGAVGDLLGDSGLDLCALLEMAEGLVGGGGDDETTPDGDDQDFDVECSTDDDGMTELSMSMDGRVECADPDLCVRDMEITLRMDFGDIFGALLGGGGGGDDVGSGGGEEEGMSFDMCFTYDDDVAEEQLRGARFCMGVEMASPMSDLLGDGATGPAGGGLGGLLSGCDARLDGSDCRCEICDGRLGMEMSCDIGEGFDMECTDFPLLEEDSGGGIGIGVGEPLPAIEPRNLMIPRLVSSRAVGVGIAVDEGDGDGDGNGNICAGSKVWCPSMEKCISPQKKCLSEQALLRRRRRRRRKGMFAKRAEKNAAKKKVGGKKKKRDGMFNAAEESDMAD